MARVNRLDIGGLKKPKVTSQGFLEVEGYASRVGIFRYLNKDGTERLELRTPEEVFKAKALTGYAHAPLTNGHPSKKVTPKNAKAVSVGHVMDSAWKDGDHVAVKTLITDSAAIEAVKKGKRGLSTGYEVDLVEEPGVHPIYGRYDAMQTNLEINHLAIEDFPRAGTTAKLRMDSMERGDAMMLSEDVSVTTAVEGHQHMISRKGYDGSIKTSGSTGYATIEGADREHTHDWFLNDDGTITITENAGHSHDLEEDNSDEELSNTDRRNPAPTRGRPMKTEKEQKNDGGKPAAAPKPAVAPQVEADALATAANEIKIARARADAAESRLAAAETRADRAEGEVVGLKAKLAEAESERTDAAAFEAKEERIRELEEEVELEKKRADAAEDPKRFSEAVASRTALLKRAEPLIGSERLDGCSDLEIMLECLTKVGRTDCAGKSEEFVKGVFETVIGQRATTQRQIDKLIAAGAVNAQTRADSAQSNTGVGTSPREQYLERQRKGSITATKGA